MQSKIIMMTILLILFSRIDAFIECTVEVENGMMIETVLFDNEKYQTISRLFPSKYDSLYLNGNKINGDIIKHLYDDMGQLTFYNEFASNNIFKMEKRRVQVELKKLNNNRIKERKIWKGKYIYAAINSSIWISLIASYFSHLKINGSYPYLLDYQMSIYIIVVSALIYLFGNLTV